MNYEQLKEVMHKYRLGRLTKNEMRCAFALWQLKEYGEIAGGVK